MRLKYLFNEPIVVAAFAFAMLSYIPLSLPIKILSVLCGLLLLMFLSVVFKSAVYMRRICIACSVGLLVGGQAVYRIQKSNLWTGLENGVPSRITAVLTEDTKRRDGYSIISFRILNIWTKEGIYIQARGKVVGIMQEEQLLGKGLIVDLGAQDITSEPIVVRLLEQHGFQHAIWKWRWMLHRYVRARMQILPYHSASLLRALFLGVDDEIDLLLRSQFFHSGSLHVLALSGMHLALLSTLCMGLLRIITSKQYAMLLNGVMLTCYLFLVGFRPSLLRAYLMVLLYSLFSVSGYKLSAISILSAAALIMGCIYPIHLRSLAFQLSFLSLFGILFWTPILQRRLSFLPDCICIPFCASLGACMMSGPLIIGHFQQLPLGGLIWSPIIGFLAMIFLLLGIGSLLLPLLSYFTEALYVIIDWITYIASFSPMLPGEGTTVLLGLLLGTAILLRCLLPFFLRRIKRENNGVRTFLLTQVGSIKS